MSSPDPTRREQPERADGTRTIDAGGALDLLERALTRRIRPATHCRAHADLVRDICSSAEIDEQTWPSADSLDFRSLYSRGGAPVLVTLGAAAIFRAARLSDRPGATNEQILAAIETAAWRIVRLVPERALAVAFPQRI